MFEYIIFDFGVEYGIVGELVSFYFALKIKDLVSEEF
jgi:hypothetical protein